MSRTRLRLAPSLRMRVTVLASEAMLNHPLSVAGGPLKPGGEKLRDEAPQTQASKSSWSQTDGGIVVDNLFHGFFTPSLLL